LIVGMIRDDHVDIARTGWTRIDWLAGEKLRIKLWMEFPERYKASFNIGVEQLINDHFGFRFLLSDYPSRAGWGIFYRFHNWIINFAVTQTQPLGWSQGAGIQFIW